jgi:hypothetical protein
VAQPAKAKVGGKKDYDKMFEERLNKSKKAPGTADE